MKHPQAENLIIAATDKDALFECLDWDNYPPSHIMSVMDNPTLKWTHVKPKPKTITKRLYADDDGCVTFQIEPEDGYYIPINGTETEVEWE